MEIFSQLMPRLGAEIHDADEETFLLFAQDVPSQNLGFVDPKAESLTIGVANCEYTIHQSPGILSSSRAGGTTGAVLWKITPHLANWLCSLVCGSPLRDVLITPQTYVLELGCGISALTALALGPHVAGYVLTDQAYVSKLVSQNLAENQQRSSSSSSVRGVSQKKNRPSPPHAKTSSRTSVGGGGARSSGSTRSRAAGMPQPTASNIRFVPLDWEVDSPTASLVTGGGGVSSMVRSFDVVLACDCIYNEALIGPFVQTCAEACKLRRDDKDDGGEADGDGHDDDRTGGGQRRPPCVCLVAQQLRNPDVFTEWLVAFAAVFRVWRIPDEMLSTDLRTGSGFVVHLGILKDSPPLTAA